MARPTGKFKTVQKTYMMYDSDIQAMLGIGIAPKDVFRLGVKAVQKGWTPEQNTTEVYEMKERIKALSWTLQSYVDKFNKLAHIVEKKFNLEIEYDVMKTDNLDKMLKEIDE